MSSPSDHALLLDLLADRAGGEPGDPGRDGEIERLLADHPEVDPQTFETAAAALHLALIGPAMEPMPEQLRRRLIEDSREVLDPASRPAPDPRRLESSGGPAPTPRGRHGASVWWGWIAAAAAVLLLILREPSPPELSQPTYDRVLAAADVVQVDWQPTEDPDASEASGRVFWSDSLQAGYMLFRGLRPNDPARGQYQLWIFDRDRPDEHPVDGGVFDVAGGEALVAIDAKLAVAEPTLFAITYERPGGVVVSSRERLLLLASAQ